MGGGSTFADGTSKFRGAPARDGQRIGRVTSDPSSQKASRDARAQVPALSAEDAGPQVICWAPRPLSPTRPAGLARAPPGIRGTQSFLFDPLRHAFGKIARSYAGIMPI